MFGKKTIDNSVVYDVVKKIEEDVAVFVSSELVLFKQNSPKTTLNNSTIANIATFNLDQMYTEEGYNQLKLLFNDTYKQWTSSRIRNLAHTLYIRYGEILNIVIARSLEGIQKIYNIDKTIIDALDKELNGLLWLVPFIRCAYQNLINYVPPTNINNE